MNPIIIETTVTDKIQKKTTTRKKEKEKVDLDLPIFLFLLYEDHIKTDLGPYCYF